MFFSLLYLAFSPSLIYQHWDSLWYCHSCEKNGVWKIWWGNHPLGHPILCSIFKMATLFGYSDRALPVLKVVNNILGALTVAGLLIGLRNVMKFTLLNSLGCAVILGATSGFWHYAGTADIYIFSVLLFLLSWTVLIYAVTSNRYLILAGILAGLAILAHQLNGVLLFVGLITILSKNAYCRPKIMLYKFLLSTMLTTVTGYLLLWNLQTPSTFSLQTLISWIIGYGTDPSFGRYLQLKSLSSAIYTALKIFITTINGEIPGIIRRGVYAIVILVLLLGIMVNRRLSKDKSTILFASLLQCSVAGFLILWWEPHNEKFWVLILLPWVITLACSFEAIWAAVPDNWPRLTLLLKRPISLFPLLLGILLILFNANYRMLKERQPNIFLQESLDQWLSHTGQKDLLITTLDLVPYLRSWGERPNAINMYDLIRDNNDSSDKFAALRTTIKKASQNKCSVFFSHAIIESCSDDHLNIAGITCKDLRVFFETYEWNKVEFYYLNLIDGGPIPVRRIAPNDSFKNQN